MRKFGFEKVSNMPLIPSITNPIGISGLNFLEFAADTPNFLGNIFVSLGFLKIGKNSSDDIFLYQQNNIRFILNCSIKSSAHHFFKLHGYSISAIGFLVDDANEAHKKAVELGAKKYQIAEGDMEIPAIEGVSNSRICFVDCKNGKYSYENLFSMNNVCKSDLIGVGLKEIDHLTQNVVCGNMEVRADFYKKIFNFTEIRKFDIKGKETSLRSIALASPCGKVKIPINESDEESSQINEYIRDYNGEGVQHIALETDDIYKTVESLRANGVPFFDNTPDVYYERINIRLPYHDENIERLKTNKILIDGSQKEKSNLLLQIFTKNIIGPIFFEIIQRKGDDGFGEGNFQALFEAIEEDQKNRGIL